MTRHRFEPSRLLLGLALLAITLVYLMDAADEWHVPAWALAVLVPLALLAAGVTALLTFMVRRLLHERKETSPSALGRLPVDELRHGYGNVGHGPGQGRGSGPVRGDAPGRREAPREGPREGPHGGPQDGPL